MAGASETTSVKNETTVSVKSPMGDVASCALCCFGWSLMAFGGSHATAGAAVMGGVGACLGDDESTVRVTAKKML